MMKQIYKNTSYETTAFIFVTFFIPNMSKFFLLKCDILDIFSKSPQSQTSDLSFSNTWPLVSQKKLKNSVRHFFCLEYQLERCERKETEYKVLNLNLYQKNFI